MMVKEQPPQFSHMSRFRYFSGFVVEENIIRRRGGRSLQKVSFPPHFMQHILFGITIYSMMPREGVLFRFAKSKLLTTLHLV